MVVAIITEQKAQVLKGKEYQDGINYNPVQLSDGRWFVAFPEAQYLSVGDIVEIFDYVSENTEEIDTPD